MSKIQVGTYSELLRRFLAMTGQEQVAGELAPEVSPVMVLEDDRPDWKFLKGERLVAFTDTRPATAVLPNTTRIRNPLGSGVVATFTSFKSSCAATGEHFVGVGALTTDLSSRGLTALARDTRWQIQNPTSMILSAQAIAVTVGVFTRQLVLANTVFVTETPVVVLPGFAVEISTSIVDEIFKSSYIWSERKLEAAEVA